MAKHLLSQAPYYYGMTDMYMQMGYFPYPRQQTDEPRNIHLEYPLAAAMALQCKYYLGQTSPISAGNGTAASGGLINPQRSGVHLYINEFAITNRSSDHSVEAKLWFGKASSLGNPVVSPQITSGFIQFPACPSAQGQIVQDAGPVPSDGTTAATHIVPAHTSVTSEKSGQWILAPGTALLFHFPAEGDAVELIVSLGWWEQPFYR
ncbi:DUF6143 family protein [Brevibacillus ruminantium]|uniref:DUF6143 family protein n=1 Tax=Brevibacillus ruminantium TaxID=2950604 RepID=A0ABY4WCK8_9BACL|nr:DUF6143 family protein [Brevibacillus ruminantium]USG64576.1 DUF6143 family protein [Brevibacillus ruminantium]